MSTLGDTVNIQESGGKLLTAIYVVLRSMRLYPVENVQVQQAIDDLHAQMVTLLESEGVFDLHLSGDFFFLNEARLRLDLRKERYSTLLNYLTVIDPDDHGHQTEETRVKGRININTAPAFVLEQYRVVQNNSLVSSNLRRPNVSLGA